MNYFVKKIKSGDAEILGSGSVISFDDKPIEIEFGSKPLKVVLTFLEDKEKPEPYGKTETISDDQLKISLFNFNDRLGAGTLEPFPIGTWERNQMFLSIRSYGLIGSKQTMLHYTFYQK